MSFVVYSEAGAYMTADGHELLDFDLRDPEHPGTELMQLDYPDGFGNCRECGEPITAGYVDVSNCGPNQDGPLPIFCEKHITIQ